MAKRSPRMQAAEGAATLQEMVPEQNEDIVAAPFGDISTVLLEDIYAPPPAPGTGFEPENTTPPPGGVTEPQIDVDVSTIKNRLRFAQLLGNPAVLQAQVTNSKQWMATFKDDGSWNDIIYTDQNIGPGWKTLEHLTRAVAMARLYRTPGHEFYTNSKLALQSITALSYWLAHDFQNPNWWHNQIGVPMVIGQILLLMDSEVAPDRVQKGLQILQRSILRNLTGANLVWAATNQLMRGLLAGASATIAEAIQALIAEIKIAGPGQEGIQADLSFHQHDALLYSGGYGQAFTVDAARVLINTFGTRFAVPADRAALLSSYILDGQQWMMRRGMFDYSVVGRQIARPNQTGWAVVDTAARLSQLALPRQRDFATFVARAQNKAPGLAGNRHFWKSDFMAHHRANYYTSVRMVSTRTFNTDGFVTDEGRNTRHLADGATLIYRSGEEYRDIFPTWDWRRVPGVTCEQRPEPLELNGLHTHGPTSFVGGVSDGWFGMAAMDLRRDSLAVKKAWFYFDSEIVCLGAGLTCPTNNPVYTSVNQCLRRGAVTIGTPGLWSNSQGASDFGMTERGWIFHDGVGYSFPAGLSIRIRHAPQTGSWTGIAAGPPGAVTKEMLSIWIDHGARAANRSFHYLIFPDIDTTTLIARTAQSSVNILSNTAALQAVQQPYNIAVAAAFYQPGTLSGGPGWNVTVNRPCLLLMRERPEGFQVAASNPLNQPLTVLVDIDRALTGEGCTSLSPTRTRITLKLPEGAYAGQSLVRILKKR